MFNGRKTIGVFVNRAEKEYQGDMCSSLIRYAYTAGYNILFFTSYEIREEENKYEIYGEKIIDIAPVEDLDGIIVALDTYDKGRFREKIYEMIRTRATCPVVSFRERADGFYCVESGANDSMRDILEHLYRYHSCRDISFMMGYEGHYDSTMREEAYRRFMADHGLTIYPNSMFRGDLWKYMGDEALRFFMSDPDRKPDAIVCANDFMARSICDAARKMGIKVPDDIRVTGVDDESIAYIIQPTLSTIGIDVDGMARESVRLISDINNGIDRERTVTVPARLLFRESCGCGKPSDDEEMQNIEYYFRINEELLEDHTKQNYFRIDLASFGPLDSLLDIISDNIGINGDVSEFYLCLLSGYDEFGLPSFTDDLPDSAELLLNWKDGERRPVEGRTLFDRTKLLPDGLCGNEPVNYYITMLYDRDNALGFTAVRFNGYQERIGVYFHNWNLTVGLTLSRYFIYKRARLLKDIYEKNSITDYLTSLYNRRGLGEFLELHRSTWIYEKTKLIFISIDVDHLKYTNDNFGHEAGDRLIKAAADAVRAIVPNNGIGARMGGDEFLAIAYGEESDAAELKARLIAKASETFVGSGNDHNLSLSVGYCCVTAHEGMDLAECIEKSDAEMYRAKISKRGK